MSRDGSLSLILFIYVTSALEWQKFVQKTSPLQYMWCTTSTPPHVLSLRKVELQFAAEWWLDQGLISQSWHPRKQSCSCKSRGEKKSQDWWKKIHCTRTTLRCLLLKLNKTDKLWLKMKPYSLTLIKAFISFTQNLQGEVCEQLLAVCRRLSLSLPLSPSLSLYFLVVSLLSVFYTGEKNWLDFHLHSQKANRLRKRVTCSGYLPLFIYLIPFLSALWTLPHLYSNLLIDSS